MANLHWFRELAAYIPRVFRVSHSGHRNKATVAGKTDKRSYEDLLYHIRKRKPHHLRQILRCNLHLIPDFSCTENDMLLFFRRAM